MARGEQGRYRGVGILDRLVHNAHRVELKGESMRKNKPAKTER